MEDLNKVTKQPEISENHLFQTMKTDDIDTTISTLNENPEQSDESGKNDDPDPKQRHLATVHCYHHHTLHERYVMYNKNQKHKAHVQYQYLGFFLQLATPSSFQSTK